jgi:asparagine synthase (glutamine-hydrolysing)
MNGAISPRFAHRTGLSDRVKGSPESTATSLRQGHAASVTGGAWEFVLSTYDKIGARNQVEQRYPFFDVRLVELCVSLPFEQRLREGRTRSILRRAMKGVLPESVRDRVGKGNLSIGVRLGLASEIGSVERVLKDPGGIEPFVDLRAFRNAFERFRADPVSASERDVFTVFLPSTLALWMERSGLSA